jgi:hypothetical protein
MLEGDSLTIDNRDLSAHLEYLEARVAALMAECSRLERENLAMLGRLGRPAHFQGGKRHCLCACDGGAVFSVTYMFWTGVAYEFWPQSARKGASVRLAA